MEVNKIGSFEIKYEGVFDDQKFYVLAQDIIKSEGFSLMETSYIQFGGANYHIEWVASKFIDDYTSYRLNIVLEFTNLNETTVMKDGKQIKAKTGGVSVNVIYSMVMDYLNKWSTGVSKFIKPIYEKMSADTIEKRKAELEQIALDIKSKLQNSLSK